MKKVLIVSRRYIRKDKLINWVSEIYLQFAAQHHVMPIIVPIAEETPNILEHYLANYDGLLMVEGGDLGPQYYNENYNINELDEYDALKDEIEIACFRHALASGKPILGFCRGMHLINAMLGGKLHKDIHEANQNKVIHIDYNNYDTHRHSITIEKQSPLFDWYQQDTLLVNTYHHQGIKVLAPALKPMAYADDQLIEGIYLPGNQFVVGLQFHPERMYDEYIGNHKVFETYFNAIKAYKK